MTADLVPNRPPLQRQRATQLLLVVILATGSIVLSTAFACATPFAALATLAAIGCNRRDALVTILAAWVGNQAIGYGLLGYPWTWDSVAWGAAIGGSACLAVLAARVVPARPSALFAIGASFAAAFVAYEAALYTASFVLPGGEYGFTAPVVGYVFMVNAGAAALLVLSHALLRAFLRGMAISSAAPRSA